MNVNHYALLIGINDYIPKYEGLGNLENPHTDVAALKAWLTDPNYGGLPAKNCITLTSTPSYEPYYHVIQMALNDIYAMVEKIGGAAERIYFYFSGHGLGQQDKEDNIALCLGYWFKNAPSGAFSSASYKDHLISFQYFEEIVFLADCCRDLTYTASPIDKVLDLPKGRVRTKRRFMEVFSCEYEQRSFGIPQNDQHQSVFNKILIEGLKGAAADPVSNSVTNTSLKNYLNYFVPKLADEHGYSQEPTFNESDANFGPIVFLQLPQEPVIAPRQFVISTPTNGPVILFNNKAEPIQTFIQGSTHTVNLPAGTYVLKDESTQQRTKLLFHSVDNTDIIVF